jgi:hypothetical protein
VAVDPPPLVDVPGDIVTRALRRAHRLAAIALAILLPIAAALALWKR